MENLSKQLGQNIRQYRKARGLKQSELAELLGVESKYLSRLETGLSTPSFKTILKIAYVFNIEVSELFEFERNIEKAEIINKLQIKIKNYSQSQLKLLLSFSKFIDKMPLNE